MTESQGFIVQLGLFFRISVLIAAFVGVIFVIRNVNQKNVEQFFQSLGVETGTSASPGLQPGSRALRPGEERFNICRTRVQKITLDTATQKRVVEEKDGMKLKWVAYDDNGRPRDLPYMGVEKWLSQHCQIIVYPVPPDKVASISSGRNSELSYVDGTSLSFAQRSQDYFIFGERTFQSSDFAGALLELETLAGLR